MDIGSAIAVFLVLSIILMALFCFVTKYFHHKLKRALEDANEVYSMVDELCQENQNEDDDGEYDHYAKKNQEAKLKSGKKKREDEIIKKEKEAKDLQKKRFGFEGDLFKKRQELVKPVQDKVYNAVQKLAASKGYDVVFDKSADLSVFYNDPKLDKSDDILRELGVTSPGKK